jgi:hypothetical protein
VSYAGVVQHRSSDVMNDLLAVRAQMAMSLAFHYLFRLFKSETAVVQTRSEAAMEPL